MLHKEGLLTVFRWMTDAVTHRRRSHAFTVDGHSLDDSQPAPVALDQSPVCGHVECGLTSTRARVGIVGQDHDVPSCAPSSPCNVM